MKYRNEKNKAKILIGVIPFFIAMLLVMTVGCSNQNIENSSESSSDDATQHVTGSTDDDKRSEKTNEKELDKVEPEEKNEKIEEGNADSTEMKVPKEEETITETEKQLGSKQVSPSTTILEKPATKYVTVSSLNVRSGAGTNHSVIMTITQGQAVTVYELSGSWSKIKMNDKTGWVSSKYLSDTKPIVQNPAPKKEPMSTSDKPVASAPNSESTKPVASGNAADKLKTISGNRQLILVTTNGYNTSKATIQTFEKDTNGKWNAVLNISGYVGKFGITSDMKEGGKKAPIGKFTIGTAFGQKGNPGTKLPFRDITSDDVWVDDPESSLYNTWQSRSETEGQWTSAENMKVPAYNYGFVINYNTERIPYKGSAIFFHIGSSYTLGCTATSEANVIKILKWLDPAKNPVIIQTPLQELNKY